MADDKKSYPYLVKKGIVDSVMNQRGSQKKEKQTSKKGAAEEAAEVFMTHDEIEILRQDYRCLSTSPRTLENMINEEVIGQEEAVSKLVYVAYFNQRANLLEEAGYDDVPERLNLLLIGPTGCGKTSAVNALKKYFQVPLAKYSSDSITSAGYIGNKVESILLRLFEESGRNLHLAERGIIFIDEIDKKRQQETSSGKDINGTAVQEELLKILEPNVIDLPIGGGKTVPFDTKRLTVIMGGAFVGLEDIIRKRLYHKSIGFLSDEDHSKDELSEEDYTNEDVIQFGFIPEFVGRTLMMAVFRKLTAEDIEKIMLYSKRSPYIECTRYLANTLNVDLKVSKSFIHSIAEELAESKTGARALRARMVNFFRPIIQYAYEHVKEEGKCTIFADGTFQLSYDGIDYFG